MPRKPHKPRHPGNAPSPDAPRPDPAPQPRGPSAARSPRAVALFVGTAIVLLGADLLVKHYAFERVAGVPLHLARSESDGTTIVRVRDDAGQLVTLERRHPHEPASAIPPHDQVTLIPRVLALKLTLNTGAVFGIGKDRQSFFAVVSLLAVAVIAFVFYRSRAGHHWLHLCLGLILSGALGNLYDRMLYNAVRDMFWLFPGIELPFGWTWPGGARDLYPWLFNIADAALVVGVGLMLVLMWGQEGKSKREADTENEGVS
jgi:signal peptidase II